MHIPATGRLTRMKIAGGKDIPLLSFDSFQEAITCATSDYDVTRGRGASRKTNFSYHQILTRSFEEALTLAREGWPEGRKQAERFIKHLDVSGRIAKPEIIYDVIGNCGIDMGRYVMGDPECVMDMIDSSEESILNSEGGKIIHIVYNISASAGIDGSIMQRRGAATMALVDALESAGRRVEVTIVDQNDYYEWRAIAKAPGCSMQIDQLAFAFVHPSMLRRFGFSITAQCGKEGLDATFKGYGRVANRPFGDIFMPGMTYGDPAWETDASAIAWITQILREQGIELEGE